MSNRYRKLARAAARYRSNAAYRCGRYKDRDKSAAADRAAFHRAARRAARAYCADAAREGC